MNTMLFNCSLSNNQLHLILKISSGFHTQKQLQDLDQQRTGHGCHGSRVNFGKKYAQLGRLVLVIFCLLVWMYDLGFEASLGEDVSVECRFLLVETASGSDDFFNHKIEIRSAKVICTAHLIWLAFFTTGCLIQSDRCLHNILACEILRLYVSSDSLRS